MRFELMTSSLPRKRSTPELHWLFRAEDEVRTRDPQLGRLMLYQLSYFRLFRFEGASSALLLVARILIYTSKLRCSLLTFLESTPSKTKNLSFIRGIFCDASSCMCGERRIRTSEGVRQQIYSLPQLATLVSPHICKVLNSRNFEPIEGFEPTTR